MSPGAEGGRFRYDTARFRAFWAALAELFSRRPHLLLPFDEVVEKLRLRSSLYRGVRPVEVARIVGSVGRARDFDEDFRPLHPEGRERRARIRQALRRAEVLPPVQLYQVGQVYFVLDGHHRVSIAREQGQEYIDAEVIELPTPVTLEPGVSPEELILKAEQAGFLEQTALKTLRPEARLEASEPGLYDVLLEHISVHRYYMGLEEGREISWEEAAAHWYDHVYLPIVEVIREQKVLEHFPGHTETDLYVWVMDHRYFLSREAGGEVPPEEASNDFVRRFGKRRRR
ncbi:MAG: DUF4032 domain-containing protein [Chloroflexia bacterium]